MRDGFSAIRASLESIGRGQNFFDWVQSFPLKLKDEEFSFKQHPELVQLYRDTHPHIVIEKAVQTGASTYAILKIFWRAAMMNRKGGYYGPTDDFIKNFTPDRVDKIISQIPDITRRLRGTDSISLKDLGTVSVYFRGLESASNVASVDLDTVVVDEASIVSQEHRVMTLDRLQHSPDPLIITLSKPETPGQGIDADFNESDQHYYLFKCPACGKWNNPVLSWPDCNMPVDRKNENGPRYMGCIYCRARLDYDKTEWVPAYPSRKDIRGYQLSHLYWSWKQDLATEMWKVWKKCNTNAKKKRFWTGDIGVPYAGGAFQLTDQILTLNQGSHGLQPFFDGFSFMGVDQGDTLHVAILHYEGNDLVCHWLMETDSFDTLNKLMDRHNVQCAVVDALPNKHSSKGFAKNFMPKVYICYYHEGELTIGDEEKDGEMIPKVTIGRDESLDDTIEKLIDGTLILPARNSGEVMETVWTHGKNMVKVETEGRYGPKKSYKKKNTDHYIMALNYARIAAGLPVVHSYGLPLLPEGASFYGKGGGRDN